MQIAMENETERTEHPVDVVEQLAAINDWSFDRGDVWTRFPSPSRAGGPDYQIAFTWLPDLEPCTCPCAFDLKAPERRRPR